MKNSDESHKITETVYKNLAENFNPGVRQIIACGKLYHKALQGLTVAARAYTEALMRVGQSARTTCSGGTEEMGEAIYEIAEAQKEIQARVEDNSKALFTELILPLEQKLENEFKRSSSQYKKYSNGHKVVWAPYSKAVESLKKFRKKSRNKPMFEEQKESQHMKTLERCQEKLDEFRMNGLKLALLEERKCHCFLLDRLNAMATLYANHHKQSAETLMIGLTKWKQLSVKPHILPPEADRLLMIQDRDHMSEINGGLYRNDLETRSLGSPYRRSQSIHDVHRRPIPIHSEGGSDIYTKTLPHGRVVPPPPPTSGLQVRAVYSHDGEGETKMSFMEGDMINIIGEKASDGWQYGLNTKTGKYGWFPLSFTEPFHMPPMRDGHSMMNGRVKSMGDLLDDSPENGSYFMEHSMPGSAQRPKSLYEGSGTRLPMNSSPPAMRSTQGSMPGYGHLSRQQHSIPPPPPPAPPGPPPIGGQQRGPAMNYGTDEEDSDFRRNPNFANVSLRRTVTNDRSKPRF
nr:brain-specific angiogenesis inhibitor 1-associated protein 2 isoform X3 [Crassostrea gigas]